MLGADAHGEAREDDDELQEEGGEMKPITMRDSTRVRLVGHAAADSGALMIVDPCYVQGFERDSIKYPYEEETNALEQVFAGSCGTGVVFHSGFGDGVYEVWVEEVDFKTLGWRVKKVEIICISEEEEEMLFAENDE